MNSQFLLLWLEAPLQSWGFDSKFNRRDTLKFPTKSGILGLLCCALGAGGDQKEFMEIMANQTQTVISYLKKTHYNTENPIKPEREPFLKDFQMVGSGYNEKDPWEFLHIPKTITGSKAVSGGTKMTFRYYLQDAYFAVIMEVPSNESSRFAEALKYPVWDLYLGRKNCIPTDFIFRGVYSSECEAYSKIISIAEEKNLIEDFKVLEGEHDGELMTLNDVPVQFGNHKKYRERIVTVVQK